MNLRVDFDVTTDPSIDQVLTNLRYSQAASQLPPDVVNQGVTVKKSVTSPLGLFVAVLAEGHVRPALPQQLRVRQHQRPDDARARCRAGADLRRGAVRHARLGAIPTRSAKLDITVNEITNALQAQNTVNPAGQIGGDPVPPRPGVHVHGAGAGPPGEPGGLRERRGARAGRTARWSG